MNNEIQSPPYQVGPTRRQSGGSARSGLAYDDPPDEQQYQYPTRQTSQRQGEGYNAGRW
ncbi:hypothetical protein TREMEDRAFT_56309 [Tremella mesenterica DSM 1558]|uniref:uncharacterized protein n=1 Tax=Tremella mesenterica (strain ATCC 24925 / CBS 8224 / DSM 1558 / NBRC 9311 / NRRL Y-6157 / RJB 2259-6 / UBC 559-6) TaxID=578456 RepID=UPI0003F4916F|nr:uncharacterized protein TREMEDRAFT_56309 [Tremella mesenterica DSM 1558]EIW71061.1 hypothetical protein TREMEDRAFT_56309 [Tremella mesenterica DSM 1558]